MSILFLGEDNTLYYPLSGASIGACRAYFKIGEDGAGPTGVGRSAWYSLDGRKLDGKPTKSGVYIREGKKVVIK